MKKKKLTYGLLIILTILTSCSSDNDNNNNGEINGKLIGTWIGISSTFNGKNSGMPDNSIVKFTSDSRTEFIYEGFGNNGQDISDFGNWSTNGNTLTITWDEADSGLENYVLRIVELNETTLKWTTDIYGMVNNQQVLEGTLTETFIRQVNNEVSKINPNDIIGEWEYYIEEYRNYGNFSELPYLATGCAADRYYKFNSNGTEDRYDYESITSNTSENIIQNGYIIRNNNCLGDFMLRSSRTFQIDGNHIKWISSNKTITNGIIQSLNQEQLIILWNDNLTEFSNWKYRVTFNRR
jgi:hypothetical protein